MASNEHRLPSRHDGEGSPLVTNERPKLWKHLSFMTEEWNDDDRIYIKPIRHRPVRILLAVIAASAVSVFLLDVINAGMRRSRPRTINEARQHLVDVDPAPLKVWFRTWGCNPNRNDCVPVLFVHGGPGNAIADYHNYNAKLFDHAKFFVVEVDQRGTGKSIPSVRDDYRNMVYYMDVSLDKMSKDFEAVRRYLGIDKWLVFGGSWGSTLGLDYALRYPQQSLGLILRGVWLNTLPEFEAIYSQKPYQNNQRRQKAFEGYYKIAADEARRNGEPDVDPDDAERIMRLYQRLTVRGNRKAIWEWHVFEENLMELDPEKWLDPNHIKEDRFPEAQSLAFFEARLFLHLAYEEKPDFLNRLEALNEPDGGVRTWICQGMLDEVCPPEYAMKLRKGLKAEGIPHSAHFLEDTGHNVNSNHMTPCLLDALEEFRTKMLEKR